MGLGRGDVFELRPRTLEAGRRGVLVRVGLPARQRRTDRLVTADIAVRSIQPLPAVLASPIVSAAELEDAAAMRLDVPVRIL
jgi:hypothetical protein